MLAPRRAHSLGSLRAFLVVLTAAATALVATTAVASNAAPATARNASAVLPAASGTATFTHRDDLLSATLRATRSTRVDLTARHATRARLAHVNGALFSASALRHPNIRFNLFDDAAFTGVVKGTNAGWHYRSWSGVLTSTKGYFYAARSGNALVVHVATVKHGIFEVSQVDGGSTYRVIHLDAVGPEDAPRLDPVASAAATARSVAKGDDSGSTIDVLVTYSNEALNAEGSLAAMRARIALAVTETNGGYRNSGVHPRLRLVRIVGLNYSESGSFDTDVARLAGQGDGYLDAIHGLRTTYGADLVALIIANTDYCGLADDINATAATAFTTVSDSCATGYYSFGHEFGHLQGARHDTYVDPTNTPYSYGHGYVNLAQHTRTVMSYNNKCSDRGFNCTRLQYWSNPNKKYHHKATGTSSTKNYLVLNKTAHRVANFRSSTIASNFSSSMNHAKGSKGWSAVSGTWTKGAKYLTSKGLANKQASAKHSGTFRDATLTAKLRRAKGTLANGLVYGDPTQVSGEWRNAYRFQYTNDGDFSVWRVANGQAVSPALVDWTASSAVKKYGWNTLRASVVSGSLTFWINGSKVWHGTDSAITQGSAGVWFYRQGSAATLQVDSASASTTAAANDAPQHPVAHGRSAPRRDAQGVPLR